MAAMRGEQHKNDRRDLNYVPHEGRADETDQKEGHHDANETESKRSSGADHLESRRLPFLNIEGLCR